MRLGPYSYQPPTSRCFRLKPLLQAQCFCGCCSQQKHSLRQQDHYFQTRRVQSSPNLETLSNNNCSPIGTKSVGDVELIYTVLATSNSSVQVTIETKELVKYTVHDLPRLGHHFARCSRLGLYCVGMVPVCCHKMACMS